MKFRKVIAIAAAVMVGGLGLVVVAAPQAAHAGITMN